MMLITISIAIRSRQKLVELPVATLIIIRILGDYAVCVNAATLALIDAGIPIRDVCCAVSCGLVTKNGEAQTLVDLGK